MKPSRTSREPPDVPPSLQQHSIDTAGLTRLEELCVSNLDFSGQSLRTINARSSVFEGVSFNGCTIAGLRLRDVRMIRCDLSNAEVRAFDARRVEFVECRLSGLRAFECRW